jgi:hypothetical protein
VLTAAAALQERPPGRGCLGRSRQQCRSYGY